VKSTVAVVLSNFNHGRYLRDSMGAICSQTRAADEIVVIDDGSIDDSVEIIEEFVARYPTIRFLKNASNVGLQTSMARALSVVTADYLVWAASDDRLLPEFLERSMIVLERHPEAGLCFSELAVLRGDSGRIERFAEITAVAHIFDLADLPEYLGPAELERRMRRAYLPMTSNSVIVRRAALLASGGYRTRLEWYADSFAYAVVALRHGACVVPRTLALLRANPESYSARGRREARLERAMAHAVLDELATADLGDVRRAFRRCPSNFRPWGLMMLELQMRRPRDWDLFAAHLLWKIREYKRNHELTWPRALASLGGRVLSGLPLVRRLTKGGQTPLHRAARLLSRALRKHDAAQRTAARVCVARIDAPVSQQTLRDVALWQGEIVRAANLASAETKVAACIAVSAARDEVRLDPLFSLLCASQIFADFSIVWGEPPDPRTGADVPRVGAGDRGTAESSVEDVLMTFAAPVEARRVVAQYFKVAHPRAFVVAVSLPEDEDGFCDAELERWLPRFACFRAEWPAVALCLLNRTTVGQWPGSPALVDIAPVRGLGFGVPEGLVFSQTADAFLGVLDAFGLAALSAGRPGVYLDPIGMAPREPGPHAWIVRQASDEECLTRLAAIVRSHPIGGKPR
jgi:glycosyltransferase involved in cell wall biosynthesis